MIAYVLLRVFLLLLLVAANAFFAAAEFSLVSVRDTRIQQLIDARRIGARIVQKLHRNLDEVVNGVQLGVTIVSLTLGWVGEPLLAQMMLGPVQDLPHASVYAHSIAIVVSFVLITFLHVILGELVPKSLALQRAEQVALAVAAPMDVFLTLTRPLLFVMSRSAGWVLRIFGSRRIRQGPVHSPDELKLIVTASRQFGEIPPFQEEMIHRALELDNVTVREVMVPRPDIFSLPGDLTISEALGRVVEEQHSRVPVYDPQRGPEHIIGVLYAKDLMRWTRLRLTSDEFDIAPPQQALVEGEIAVVLEGSVSIRDLESQYQLLLPRDSGFETLAGFILARLQRIPRQGESFDYDGHRYTVQEIEGHRIAKVRIEKLEAKAVAQAGD